MRLVLSLLFFISLQSTAQINPTLIEKFEAAFQEYADNNKVIGLSIAIRGADDVWTDQYGISAESESLTQDHLFAMGSVSKTITSATILQMYEEDLLSLEDPVSLYLDTYTNVDPRVTIRQLLNHTSGIYNYTDHPDFFNDAIFVNPEQIILPQKILANYVLASNFKAGTNFSYSNTNYVLLGLIIEQIVERPYYAEARERFNFDTNYPSLVIAPYEISPENLAHLWGNIDGSGVEDVQASGLSLNKLFSGGGAAGAYVATPKDLSKWTRDLYSGKILKPSTMVELFTPSKFNKYYGLGVTLLTAQECSTDMVGHTGDIIYTTESFYDPKNDLAVTVQTNDGDTNQNMMQLAFDLFCINTDFVLSINEEKQTESLAVYPNPFTNQISISYDLATSRKVSLVLLDNTGRQIINVAPSRKEAGIHNKIFNVNVSSGMYFLKLILDDQIIHRKIIKN